MNYSDVPLRFVSCEATYAGLVYNDRNDFRARAHPFSVKRYRVSSGVGNTSNYNKRSKSLLESCNAVSIKDTNRYRVVVIIIVVVVGIILIVIIQKYRLVFKYSSRHSVAVILIVHFVPFSRTVVCCTSRAEIERGARGNKKKAGISV